MAEFSDKQTKGFNKPTALPGTDTEREAWQKENYSWWQEHPMSYDWDAGIPFPKFSKNYYREIDRRFFRAAKEYFLFEEVPFDELADFKTLKNKDVLEIGVGNGSHAQLLAERSRSFTGIDLTDYAVESTAERMKTFNLTADIRKMDAEQMSFPDASFDFIWSWGVIHHSSNTMRVLREIYRVLRPGGTAMIMVYNRGWWNYYVLEVVWGVAHGVLLRTRSLAQSVQAHTDGALARYYTKEEWRKTVSPPFIVLETSTRGPKADIILLPSGKIKNFVSKFIPNVLNRFLTKDLGMGSFLVSRLKK